jgi:hypothetical protein
MRIENRMITDYRTDELEPERVGGARSIVTRGAPTIMDPPISRAGAILETG